MLIKNRNFFIVILLLTKSYIFLLFINYLYYLDLSQINKIFLLFLNILIIAFIILILIFLNSYTKLAKKQAEVESLEHYIDKTKKLINVLNSKSHEYKRCLQKLQSMLRLNEIEEAREYITRLSENEAEKKDTNNCLYVREPILNMTLNTYQIVAKEKNIEFNIGIKTDLYSWNISPWNLDSILGNLLNNSFDAVLSNNEENKKYIALEVLEDHNKFIVKVINNGPKITKSKKEKMFQPGYTTKASSGSGYGLHIVNKILQEENGWTEVFSNEQKTIFKVCFPRKMTNI